MEPSGATQTSKSTTTPHSSHLSVTSLLHSRSTTTSEMQTVSPQHRYFEPKFNLNPETGPMYGASDHWAPSPQGDHVSTTTAEYMGFPVANARPSDSQFTIQSSFEQTNTPDHDIRNKSGSKRSFADLDTQSNMNGPLGISTATMYSSSAVFTANNTHIGAHEPATISPVDTRVDVDHASPISDCKFSFDGQVYNTGSNFTPLTDDTDSLSSKRRCDSLQSNFVAHSPTIPPAKIGRRRGSEYAEPGSARAVYLEKNRKAASKCRSKQKRQQEELVETARDVERRNRILKAEVEVLKSGMQDLMQLVGQHTECPDTRLRLYLQREADRLATGGQRNALPSPMSGSISSYSGIGSIDKVSSPEEE